MPRMTISVADTRNHFSKIASEVNATNTPVTVFRNSKPWVVISPAHGGLPNAETIQAMGEAERMAVDPAHRPFATFEDMMSALERA